VPASLAHRLSPTQLEQLQAYGAAQCACRKDVVELERLLESGAPFEAALAQLEREKASHKCLANAAGAPAFVPSSAAAAPASAEAATQASAAAQMSAPASPAKA
jgi:hypothetical protein